MTCPDCNGKGEILLLTSTVPCERCQGFPSIDTKAVKNGPVYVDTETADEFHIKPSETLKGLFFTDMLNAPIAPDRNFERELQNIPYRRAEDRVHRMSCNPVTFKIKGAQRSEELDRLFRLYQERFAQSVREHLEKFNEKS